jgi:hypothetical protein
MPLRCPKILKVFVLILICGQSFAQSNADRADSNNHLVKWNTDCAPRGCLMHTAVLRGDSGKPADPRDAREYVGISIALERETGQPTSMAFSVDPRATRNQGIFIGFARTTKSGNSWKMELDNKSTVRIPIASCGDVQCLATVPKGIEVQPSTRQQINLMNELLTFDEVLILYIEGKNAYRTMIPLASFHEDYKKVMTADMAPPQTPHTP